MADIQRQWERTIMEIGNTHLILISASLIFWHKARKPLPSHFFCCFMLGSRSVAGAHWEPPTITKISPCKMVLGITNVKQNGLIRSSPFKCAQTKAPGILRG